MKIAYITQSYPPMISGAAIVVERLAQDMAARGHQIVVVAASDRGCTYVTQEHNTRVFRLTSIPNPKRANQFFTLGPPATITSILKSFQPEIIHIHDVLWMGVTALRLGRKLDVPVIASIHQLPGFVSAYLPAIPGFKLSVEWSLWRYSRWLNNQCACMTVPTHTISRTIETIGGFKTRVIGHGVDLDHFNPISNRSEEMHAQFQKLRLDFDKPVILHVGRLDIDKRVDIVVRAAAMAMQRCDAQLLVVGDGECRQSLIELADLLGIGSRSRFPGFLDQKQELPSVYRIASVFTTASEIETQGLVLLEALASGLPVVAVDATCISEVIKDNINGYLVQPGDVRAIGAKLVEVIRDPDRAKEMGAAGRVIVREHAIDKSFDRFEQLYDSIVNTFQENHASNLLPLHLT